MRVTPYEIQYEIYKNMAPGLTVDWDRYFPTPGIWNYVVTGHDKNGHAIYGMLRFDWPLILTMSARCLFQRLVEQRTRYLMRAFAEQQKAPMAGARVRPKNEA